MSLRTETYFRAIADDALTRAGVSEPPVPVDALAAALGIPVRPVNLPPFFTGATVYEDGLPVMILNWAKSEYERRRCMAHMLGHVLLVLNGEVDAYPREAAIHQDADRVARELMLPGGMVIEQARLWFNDHRYLARLFGVEEQEMVDRMQDLGLIKGPVGVMWDY